jgi:hypothetical protein
MTGMFRFSCAVIAALVAIALLTAVLVFGDHETLALILVAISW